MEVELESDLETAGLGPPGDAPSYASFLGMSDCLPYQEPHALPCCVACAGNPPGIARVLSISSEYSSLRFSILLEGVSIWEGSLVT